MGQCSAEDPQTLILMCGCALSVMLLTLAVVLSTPHDYSGTFQGEYSARFTASRRAVVEQDSFCVLQGLERVLVCWWSVCAQGLPHPGDCLTQGLPVCCPLNRGTSQLAGAGLHVLLPLESHSDVITLAGIPHPLHPLGHMVGAQSDTQHCCGLLPYIEIDPL